MKSQTVRKMALGLAATSVMSINSGCDKKEATIPETASIVSEEADNIYEGFTIYTGGSYEYKGKVYKEAHNPSEEYIVKEYTDVSYDEGLNTDSIFFVRIDGKTYLATKLVDKNENNIISKYYALDTGEFLGQTLDVNWYARATSNITEIIPQGSRTQEYTVSINEELKDINYFNGEYGLGKNLSSSAIINATSIFSDKRLSKVQIEELLKDPLLVSSYVEKYHYPSSIMYSKEDYTFIPLRYAYDPTGIITYAYTIGFYGETSYHFNGMFQFKVEDNNSIREFIGYRASTNESDIGYNYIYDIASSSYVDISQFELLDVKKVGVSKTIGEIRKGQNNLLETYYSIDDLKVVSTLNLEGDDVFENYYIAMRDGFINSDYKYKILGESDILGLSGNYDGSRLSIAKICLSNNKAYLKATAPGAYDGIIFPLKECLTKTDLSRYIKETYTEEELATLISNIRSNEFGLRKITKEAEARYKKINIEDVIVVDTSKESGNSVLVNGDKRYYLLVPYEISGDVKSLNQNMRYYETCDHSALGTISLNFDYVKINNSERTFYCASKTLAKLQCILFLESTLRELSLDDFIKEDYSLMDLQYISDQMNEKVKVLTFTK